jgi:hypothetical protein
MAAATLHLSHSSKRVQRAWRRFASQQQSTTQLAQAFVDQGVSSLDSQAAEDESAAAAAAAEAPAGPEEEEGEVQEQPLGPIVMIGGMGGSSAAAAKHAVFEEFAAKLQSPVTIRSAQVSWWLRVALASVRPSPLLLRPAPRPRNLHHALAHH